MKIKFIISILLIPFTIICQINDRIAIKRETIHYSIDTISYSNVKYTVQNTSDCVIWLWFKENSEPVEIKEVKNYFYKSIGDLNLIHLLTDANVSFTSDYSPVLFHTFLKYIRPNDCFTIQIYYSKELTNSKRNVIFKYLEKHLVVISDTKLHRYIDLPNFEQLNHGVFYKGNSIILPSNFEKMCNILEVL